MNNKRRLVINMTAQIFSFLMSFLISFFLTPFIIRSIGKEANGFIGLAENFINYATIFTTALNSMASRFVTLAIHKKDMKSVNEYFSSLVISNIIISVPLTIVFAIIIALLGAGGFIDVSENIILDVRILWTLLFLNFIIGLIGNVFNVATYSQNRLDLSSARQIIAHIIRCIVLLICFTLFKPNVWYVGLAGLIMRNICSCFQCIFYKETFTRS